MLYIHFEKHSSKKNCRVAFIEPFNKSCMKQNDN